ncbi:MAG: RraA family protein [Blastocatellia bacterium]
MRYLTRSLAAVLLLFTLLLGVSSLPFRGQSQSQVPAGLRAQRDTWTPLMDVLKDKRPRVTDEQLERLRKLPVEAVWGYVQGKGYRFCFVNHLRLTQPGVKMVGRALTMRYLPQRPDLDEGVKQLAKEGGWDHQYNVRAGEDARPGDVAVVEIGGAVDRATFMGDMTGLAMKLAGTRGVVVDGGIRDLNEFLAMKDFPTYYAGAHASAMADHIGVEWNAPVRIGLVTVLPGDVVVGDEEGVLFFPPQLADDVIKAAENTVYTEEFKRQMMNSKKYRTRDVYPRLSPELEKVFEEWKKTHPRKP